MEIAHDKQASPVDMRKLPLGKVVIGIALFTFLSKPLFTGLGPATIGSKPLLAGLCRVTIGT